jgi:hypothetical protein
MATPNGAVSGVAAQILPGPIRPVEAQDVEIGGDRTRFGHIIDSSWLPERAS